MLGGWRVLRGGRDVPTFCILQHPPSLSRGDCTFLLVPCLQKSDDSMQMVESLCKGRVRRVCMCARIYLLLVCRSWRVVEATPTIGLRHDVTAETIYLETFHTPLHR